MMEKILEGFGRDPLDGNLCFLVMHNRASGVQGKQQSFFIFLFIYFFILILFSCCENQMFVLGMVGGKRNVLYFFPWILGF